MGTDAPLPVEASKLQSTIDAFPQLLHRICDALTARDAIGLRGASRGLRLAYDCQPWALDVRVPESGLDTDGLATFLAALVRLPREVAVLPVREPDLRDPQLIRRMVRVAVVVLDGLTHLTHRSNSCDSDATNASPLAALQRHYCPDTLQPQDQPSDTHAHHHYSDNNHAKPQQFVRKLTLPGYVVSEFPVAEAVGRACPRLRELRVAAASHLDDLRPLLRLLPPDLKHLALCDAPPWSRNALPRLLHDVFAFSNLGGGAAAAAGFGGGGWELELSLGPRSLEVIGPETDWLPRSLCAVAGRPSTATLRRLSLDVGVGGSTGGGAAVSGGAEGGGAGLVLSEELLVAAFPRLEELHAPGCVLRRDAVAAAAASEGAAAVRSADGSRGRCAG